LIAADSPASFLDDTPTAKLARQVLGAISEFGKAMLVAKLKGAGEPKRAVVDKCEGRKSHAEPNPDLVREAKRLRRAHQRAISGPRRTIAGELTRLGYVNSNNRPFSASSIKAMIEARTPDLSPPLTPATLEGTSSAAGFSNTD
jgi:hypothetical protein